MSIKKRMIKSKKKILINKLVVMKHNKIVNNQILFMNLLNKIKSKLILISKTNDKAHLQVQPI